MKSRLAGTHLKQGLAALALLGLLTALFIGSSLREPIGWQVQNLNYLRGKALRRMFETSPEKARSPVAQPLSIGADRASGFYDRPVEVRLTRSGPGEIYYRLDGGVSSGGPVRYRRPIVIDRTSVLSFASSAAELATRTVESRTYLLKETGELPVLSLALNPAFLWNRYSGIYRNAHQRGRAWQRPAQAEYFEARDAGPMRFSLDLKIHGNGSRSADKKSFQLTYGSDRVSGFDRQAIIVPPDDRPAERALVVRALATDASYRLGDELFRSVYADAGGLMARGTTVQLLINGVPWGLYKLYEKIDKALLQRRHGDGDYVLISDPAARPTQGGDDWRETMEFFASNDLSKQSSFERGAKLIDMENFTDYWLFNIYAGNMDWPHNNYYAFRKRMPGERWRWMSWDTDATFDGHKGLAHDTLAWATRARLRHDLSYAGREYDEEGWLASTAIIRSLLMNQEYQKRFTQRFCALHNSYFQPDRLRARFQTIVNQITPQLKIDWRRWSGSEKAYAAAVEGIYRFISERPAIVLEHFRKRFHFSDCPAT